MQGQDAKTLGGPHRRTGLREPGLAPVALSTRGGNGPPSRLRAVREWPGLVDELAAKRRRVEDLWTALLGIVAAEADLTGAEARRTSALEPDDATLALETGLDAPASATT